MSKQPIRAPEKSSETDRQHDFPLDKYVFRTATYGLAGFGVGLAASLFFKHKLPITALFTGAGAGYGMYGLSDDWQKQQKYKSWMNTQTQQRDDSSKGGRDLDSFNFNQYAQAQRNHEWTRQSKEDFKSNQQKTEQKKDDNQRQQFERKSDQEKADNQRQKRDQKDQDKDSGSKFERKGQQGKQEDKSNEQKDQQNKQQVNKRQSTKEEPMNPEARLKKDIAEKDYDKPEEQGPPKMARAREAYPFSQDKKKREEDQVYSQSMQGGNPMYDDVQRGERGPQNPRIPPSQRDWTGGHANKGVFPQQVHRGAPEADKLGKSARPDTAPNKNPDQGAPQQGNQALSNVDFKGQKLQTFQSNPLELGKAGPTHEIQKNYQEGRNRANDPNLDNLKRRQAGLEQDRMGKSVKQGILFTQNEKSDTESGIHNYQPVAEKNLKNQVNAVLE